MSRVSWKVLVGCVAAAAAILFVGVSLLGFVERWGPMTNPLASRPVIVPPRPAMRIAEVVPPTAAVTVRDVPYAGAARDAPGWRVRAEEVVDAAAKGSAGVTPWRGDNTLVWRQPLNGQGNSSPIVVGERIFVTIADDGPTLWLVCFNLDNGFVVWRQTVSREPFPPRHVKTSDAASTPCSDGTRVFVAHANDDTVFLTAFRIDGHLLWTTKPGPFTARWGFSSSPAWARGLVIVGADNAQEGFLAAVGGETGRVVWRRRRPPAGSESHSSPVVAVSGSDGTAEPFVVLAGLERIEAYALGSGRTLWTAGGLTATSGATAVIDNRICIATSGGYQTRTMVALEIPSAGGTPAVRWKPNRDSEIPYVPTPVAHEGRLYVVNDDGLAHCRDLAAGTMLWKRRVGGPITASPVIVNGELLCADESGRCTLLDLTDGTVRHEFTVSGGCFATPVVVRDRLVIRTTAELVSYKLRPAP